MQREIIQQEKLLMFQPKTSFTVISRGRVVNIRYEEITHISKYGDEVVLYTLSGEFRTRHSLQELLNDLPVNNFFRIHRSHIASLEHMNGMNKGRLKVAGFNLPVSNYFKLQLVRSLRLILNREYSFHCEAGLPQNKCYGSHL